MQVSMRVVLFVDYCMIMIMDLGMIFFSCASINGDGDQFFYVYIPNKHENTYYGLVCTSHLLDGDNFFVIFGLFIIG